MRGDNRMRRAAYLSASKRAFCAPSFAASAQSMQADAQAGFFARFEHANWLRLEL